MAKGKLLVVAALVMTTLGGCFFWSRPCRDDCYWDHGRRVCNHRCR